MAKTTAATAAKTSSKKSTTTKKGTATKVKTETIRSWYDYPELYELGFLEETPTESLFLMNVFNKYVPFPVERVLETGCGSGRLICDMAKRGFAMTGLDLNPTSLDYCQAKLNKDGCRAELVVGDMTQFHFDKPFDAVVNAINTFRHLETEEAALAHLNCVADHLKPGGVFVLSLHLLPRGGDLWGTERWTAKTDDMSIYYALTVVETSMKTRLEKLRISMLVKKKEESFRLADHITLRIYTVDQLKSLLAKCPKLKIAGVHDFWYDIDSTQKLNSNACDTILVLQRV
ncbi:Cypemycin methyltransferase [Pirellula sp. SH-Sr6A]|uniref:class I SAM-dependent methyltransferase n=1 Tax=Pirellula sp. SH-Sr6A TaxID=1632865 RepID=UPI00078E2EE5|nr:class I SAM-dependent methyltransferase [Pirellula sp. SH-Sr6A]AMV32343.1 Cypemycin methyltransferase [Pirellula sp. SH-Sr6A]